MVDGVVVKAGNRNIKGQCRHVMGINPVVMQAPVVILFSRSFSVKLDRILSIWTNNTPWIAILEPHIRLFDLPPIFNILIKNPVIIPNAIANSRYTERSHRIKEAGCQPTQSSIAKSSIYFRFAQLVIVQPQILDSIRRGTLQLQNNEHISQEPANKVFHR